MLARLLCCCALWLLATSSARAQPATDSDDQPVYGTPVAPSVQPVALSGTLARQGDLAWTLVLDEANTDGDAFVGAAAPAPGGEVCALSNETLSAASSGPVLTRVGADGTVLWTHPLVEATPATSLLFDVAASGSGCVGVVRPTSLPPSSVSVIKADNDGVAWSREVTVADAERLSSVAFAGADPMGNVWVAVQSQPPSQTAAVTLLSRFDQEGMVLSTASYEAESTTASSQLSGFAALPDGRVVVSSTGAYQLLIADPSGATTVVETDAGFTPFALGADNDGVVLAGLSIGPGGSQIAVRRFALDGAVGWTTTLAAVAAFSFPQSNVAIRDGSAYVAWGTVLGPSSGLRVARLNVSDGQEQWQQALPDDGVRNVEGVRADAEGVVVWAGTQSASGTSLLVAYNASGALRWEQRSTNRSGFRQRTLVPCAGAATCLVTTTATGAWAVEAYEASGDQAWAQVRAGVPSAVYELHSTTLAPGGGVYLFGTTRTEEGGRDLLVARVAPDGTLQWASAVDGGGTDDAPQRARFRPAGSITVAVDGDVLVSGTSVSDQEQERALVARLAPNGTARWVSRLDREPAVSGQFAGSVVDDGAGGAAVPVLIDDFVALAVEVVRLNADGGIDGTTRITDAEPYPLGFHRTSTGYALVSPTSPESTIRVYRFAENGDLTSTRATGDLAGCDIVWANFDVPTGIDYAETVHVIGQAFGGSACDGLNVFQFTAEGAVSRTSISTLQLEPSAFAVRADGAAVVGYMNPDGDRILRIAPDRTIEWNTPLDIVIEDVALGPGVGALAVGPTRDDAAPVATAYVPGVGTATVPLNDLGGLVTTPRTALVADDGTGYVGLDAEAFGIGLVGLARIDDALPVTASQDEPQPAIPLLARVGPNPLRAGAPLRLTLGDPADLALYDLLGRRVAAWDAVPPGDFEAALTTRLAAGLYVLRAEGEDAAATLRVTILR
ncbi:MAG: hypothetical protein AAF089_08760 [Bacteroidota bacterium]